jgi:hypothetical protein
MKLMSALTKNEIWMGRFAPCAGDHLLLKPLLATVRRAVAQKVLLLGRGLEQQLFQSNSNHSRFKRKLMNTNILKRQEALRGKASGRETQQPNLITKGRNQRQINE